MLSSIVQDFFTLGHIRILARLISGVRGLVVVWFLAPELFGQYTVWLLFIFYFSLADFSILSSLEKDIPYHRGSKQAQAEDAVVKTGWSLYTFLTVVSSLGLGIFSFCVLREPFLAVLLTVYLASDKLYRAYDVNSKIEFRFKENVYGDLIQSVLSLALIYWALPRFGPYSILISMIVASVVGSFFLATRCPLRLDWALSFRPAFAYLKNTIPFSAVVHIVEVFHAIALTVIGWRYGYETLGYFAFAFRIFQIFCYMFPYFMQEMFRSRMYYASGQNDPEEDSKKSIFLLLGIYSGVVFVLWLFVYLLAGWAVQRFIPIYEPAVRPLIVLTLALAPVGMAQMCSDYLCSPRYQKTWQVFFIWFAGVAGQAVTIFLLYSPERVLQWTPSIYLAISFFVCGLIMYMTFRNIRSILLLSIPSIIGLVIVLMR